MLTYPFSQSYGYYYSSNLEAVGVAILVAMILAVVFYFTFLNKKNEGKFKGFAAKVYNFFNFNMSLRICAIFSSVSSLWL